METTLTPETDDHQINMHRYEFDEELALTYQLARKLERERDEARQALSGRTVSCSQCNEMAKRIDELEGGSFHSCHDQCQRPACIKRREKDAAIAELNQRLTEQRESFMSQLVRIEDGWREKLRDAKLDTQIWMAQATEAVRQVQASDCLNRELLERIAALHKGVENARELVASLMRNC